MSIILNKYKRLYYPIESSNLNRELKAYVLSQIGESYLKVQYSFQNKAERLNDSRIKEEN